MSEPKQTFHWFRKITGTNAKQNSAKSRALLTLRPMQRSETNENNCTASSNYHSLKKQCTLNLTLCNRSSLITTRYAKKIKEIEINKRMKTGINNCTKHQEERY